MRKWKMTVILLYFVGMIAYGGYQLIFDPEVLLISISIIILGSELLFMFVSFIKDSEKMMKWVPGVLSISGLIIIALMSHSEVIPVVQFSVSGLALLIAYIGGIVRASITAVEEKEAVSIK